MVGLMDLRKAEQAFLAAAGKVSSIAAGKIVEQLRHL